MPENLPISKLLRHFQASHQFLAFVIDEYGTVIGVVTLENVLEQIIGNVEDEFDTEQTDIVPDGPDEWIVLGSTPVDEVERRLGIPYGEAEADTFSGLLMHHAERILTPGDRIELSGFVGGSVEVRDDRAYRVRVSRRDEALPPEIKAGASEAPVTTAELFRDLTDVYEVLVNWPQRLAREEPFYRRLFAAHQVSRVFGRGLRTGHHAAMFHRWGLAVEGADVSPGMIERARRQHGQSPNLRWVVRSSIRPSGADGPSTRRFAPVTHWPWRPIGRWSGGQSSGC